jgi:hypothetical protein
MKSDFIIEMVGCSSYVLNYDRSKDKVKAIAKHIHLQTEAHVAA